MVWLALVKEDYVRFYLCLQCGRLCGQILLPFCASLSLVLVCNYDLLMVILVTYLSKLLEGALEYCIDTQFRPFCFSLYKAWREKEKCTMTTTQRGAQLEHRRKKSQHMFIINLFLSYKSLCWRRKYIVRQERKNMRKSPSCLSLLGSETERKWYKTVVQ